MEFGGFGWFLLGGFLFWDTVYNLQMVRLRIRIMSSLLPNADGIKTILPSERRESTERGAVL